MKPGRGRCRGCWIRFAELLEFAYDGPSTIERIAVFFRRLDEEFPGWEFYLGKAPSHSAESAEFYRRLGAEFQEALELFNDFLR